LSNNKKRLDSVLLEAPRDISPEAITPGKPEINWKPDHPICSHP